MTGINSRKLLNLLMRGGKVQSCLTDRRLVQGGILPQADQEYSHYATRTGSHRKLPTHTIAHGFAELLGVILWLCFCAAALSQERPLVEQIDRHFRIAGYCLIGATAADFAMTRWGLGKPGLVEGNSVVGQHAGGQAAIMTGATVACLWATHRLHDQGHTRGAKIMRWIGVGLHSGCAISNGIEAHGR